MLGSSDRTIQAHTANPWNLIGLLQNFAFLWVLIPSTLSIVKTTIKPITVNALWWNLLPFFRCRLPERPLNWSWCSCESSCIFQHGVTRSASPAGLCTCTSCCLPSSIPWPARANSCQSWDALEVPLQISELVNKIPEWFSYVEDTWLISCSSGVFFWGRDSESKQGTNREFKNHSSKGGIITDIILALI